MKIFSPIIWLYRLIAGSIRLILIVISMIIGVIVIFAIFVDDLPIGEADSSLTSADIGPYVDLHTHVAGLGLRGSGCFISERMLNSYKYYFYLHALGVSREELEREGDGVVVASLSKKVAASRFIDKAVVLALDGVVDENGALDKEATELYVPNEFLAREVKKYDNLFFGASINPYRKDALLRLVQAQQAGAVLIKWIPAIMNIDPADKRLKEFYQSLIELDMPLLSHAGAEASFTQANNALGDPLRLEYPLSLGVKVIAAHIATTGKSEGEDNFTRILPLFEKYPNLYSDISSLTQINKLGYLKKSIQIPTLKNRLVYGSDWPLQFFPLVSPWYHFRNLRIADMRYLSSISNPFDRDVLLKKALGTPYEVFVQGEELLAIPPNTAFDIGDQSSVLKAPLKPEQTLPSKLPQAEPSATPLAAPSASEQVVAPEAHPTAPISAETPKSAPSENLNNSGSKPLITPEPPPPKASPAPATPGGKSATLRAPK